MYAPVMPGEDLHKLGEDGARRAKEWLDATGRVTRSWTVYDNIPTPLLEFHWPHDGGKPFSYDIGGMFDGGELDLQRFMAECKKYSHPNQGGHFDKFLAQTYVMLKHYHYAAPEHILWMTWHPFRQTNWNKLSDQAHVISALKKHKERVFPPDGLGNWKALVDFDIVKQITQRVWVIVLSDRQEKLVISDSQRKVLASHRIDEGRS